MTDSEAMALRAAGKLLGACPDVQAGLRHIPPAPAEYALLVEGPKLRARIAELERALSALVAADKCNYQRYAMRHEGLFDKARVVLAKGAYA